MSFSHFRSGHPHKPRPPLKSVLSPETVWQPGVEFTVSNEPTRVALEYLKNNPAPAPTASGGGKDVKSIVVNNGKPISDKMVAKLSKGPGGISIG
jgi:hypothetical protein